MIKPKTENSAILSVPARENYHRSSPLTGAEMSNPSSSKLWRQRLRISVRKLIVLVLAVGGYFGWLVHSARIQREIVAEIERHRGSSVHYVWQPDRERTGNLGDQPFSTPPILDWLVDCVGTDYFSQTDYVVLQREGGADDALIAIVSRLTQIEKLEGGGPKVTDSGLLHVSKLHRLKWLGLYGTGVTDAGLVRLGG
jgi:hypothetical protein